MNTNTRFFAFLLIGFLILPNFFGCDLFVDLGLKTSTYELYDSHIPGGTLDMMELLLDDFDREDPSYRYLISYYDDDRCVGRYYAADTLNYEVEGTWSLPEHDVLRIDLDQFVDGDFKITKLDKVTYLLESDANRHGFWFDPPTMPLQLYTRKVH